MASERHSDSDGSDVFWPGYVDAVTNLVLNLLFLLTIMTVAVFMFALELGRASQGGSGNTPVAARKKDGVSADKAKPDLARENMELKREIQRLNLALAERVAPRVQLNQPGLAARSVDGTSPLKTPLVGLDKAVAGDPEVVVRFKDEAVALAPAELDRLRESLKGIAAGGRSTISVDVPAGFSESKRMAFYRAMAVRNLLIEMKVPKENISVSVREVKANANASLVRVRPR